MMKITALWKRIRGVALRVSLEILGLAVLGILWAWYRTSNHTEWTLGDSVEDAFKAFFFVGYFYNYVMRTVKVSDDKARHGDIVQKQETLLAQLTDATDRLIGHASGGESVGWLLLAHPQNNQFLNITANVEGDYPLLDCHASLVDLDQIDKASEAFRISGNARDFFSNRVSFSMRMLQPNMGTLQNQVVACDTSKQLLRYWVDWYARNGRWRQHIQLKRNGDRWDTFTAIERDGKWVFESPPRDALPKRADGSPDVFWFPEVTTSS